VTIPAFCNSATVLSAIDFSSADGLTSQSSEFCDVAVQITTERLSLSVAVKDAHDPVNVLPGFVVALNAVQIPVLGSRTVHTDCVDGWTSVVELVPVPAGAM
jgi:hypothetical protein